MTSVQIKNVPPDTHRVLKRRAAAAHQSLQEYLRAHLIAEAERPTAAEVIERAKGRTGGSFTFDDVTSLLRADRDRH